MNTLTFRIQWLIQLLSSWMGGCCSRRKVKEGKENVKENVEGISFKSRNGNGEPGLTEFGSRIAPNNEELVCICSGLSPHHHDHRRGVSVTPDGDAVVIRDARKSYRSGQPVLNGLNMTVPCGSIYGLLGSSGCGKTTVLSCIVGLRKLDRGKILIFGERPGQSSIIGVPGKNVGYMPQDISLHMEFTIMETFKYFGTLHGMRMGGIERNANYLIDLLSLPRGSTRVGSLSGGQQRRVSLIVALLSSPELLILDEPTVGVDPLIRQKIWSHLRKLVQSRRTTIIITTHYIEECRGADNIGIMRNGRLLEEGQTELLMSQHGTDNLEKIVLDLARKSEDSLNCAHITTDIEELPTKLAKVLRVPNPGLMDSISRIQALTMKNFVILFRNPILLFLTIFCAAAVGSLGLCTLGMLPRDLPLGLINHEISSCENVAQLIGQCSMDMLSCRFLSHLTPDILILKPHMDEVTALADVREGTSWGYISFSSNFSASLLERAASQRSPDDIIFDESQIVMKLDQTDKLISTNIRMTLLDAFEKFHTGILEDCGYDKRRGEYPIQFLDPIFGSSEVTFRDFMAPGTGLVLMYFFPVITTGLRYVAEKKNGLLHRSMVSGVRMWEVMVAYSISEFSVLLLQALLNYLAMTLIFDITIRGDGFLVYLLFLLAGYGGVSMGFLLGIVCTEEIQVSMVTVATFSPNIYISGVLWPPEGAFLFLQYIIKVLPCTLAAEAARSVTSRGWEFTHPNVFPGFAVLVAYIVGHFILSVIFTMRFQQ